MIFRFILDLYSTRWFYNNVNKLDRGLTVKSVTQRLSITMLESESEWDKQLAPLLKLKCHPFAQFSLCKWLKCMLKFVLLNYPSRDRWHLHMNINWLSLLSLHTETDEKWEDCMNQSSAVWRGEVGLRENEREEVMEMRGRGRTAHWAQDRISIMSLCCSTQTETDLITFRQCKELPHAYKIHLSLWLWIDFSGMCVRRNSSTWENFIKHRQHFYSDGLWWL